MSIFDPCLDISKVWKVNGVWCFRAASYMEAFLSLWNRRMIMCSTEGLNGRLAVLSLYLVVSLIKQKHRNNRLNQQHVPIRNSFCPPPYSALLELNSVFFTWVMWCQCRHGLLSSVNEPETVDGNSDAPFKDLLWAHFYTIGLI